MCHVHKHRQCDRQDDCTDGSDERGFVRQRPKRFAKGELEREASLLYLYRGLGMVLWIVLMGKMKMERDGKPVVKAGPDDWPLGVMRVRMCSFASGEVKNMWNMPTFARGLTTVTMKMRSAPKLEELLN